jgi:PPOX class probable F420-dependent enzyme
MPTLDAEESQRRLASGRVATLATLSADGRPVLVPITFSCSGDRIVSVVDHKPKTTSALRRLDNIRRNPTVSVLVHDYDDADWDRLWWVRADGRAHVVSDGTAYDEAIEALIGKYPQYRETPPSGSAVVVDVTSWRGWSAT